MAAALAASARSEMAEPRRNLLAASL